MPIELKLLKKLNQVVMITWVAIGELLTQDMDMVMSQRVCQDKEMPME